MSSKKSPLENLIEQVNNLTKGKTPVVGMEVELFAIYPDESGDGLVRVSMGGFPCSPSVSAKRTDKAGKETGGNVNFHGTGKAVDPRALDVSYQVGVNITAIKSALW